MKTAKQVTRAVAAVVMILVLLGLGTVTAQPGRAGKPDRTKPVPATDIALAKKISIKGGRPAGRGGPKRAEAATGILGADLPAGSGKYAIIVGISDYPGTGSDLNYADADAADVGNALQTAYGFTDIVTLTNLDATRANIVDAIAAVPSDTDELVFFFSGHGMSGRADDGDTEKVDEAIVAHDGEELVPIWDGELESFFAACPATRIVFIFDICLAGGMDDLAGPGRVILMASSEHGYSYELSDLENGEFTYYFAEQGILGGEANIHDYFGEGTGLPEQVTAEEGFDYAKANCRLDRPTISDGFDDDLLP